MNLWELTKEVSIILGGLTIIASIIYYAIRAKLMDEFCMKIDCKEKHNKLDNNLSLYRSGISDDIKEMKEMLKEIRTWVFDFINRGAKK